ncbi:hypothetical protein DE146DRAFT_622805 [Phaeosphaeria sp. MPI-PUGE-AT-0046c]|nr:hypothetical protein DE146DRAFT_622805 [Phaeosphaeria sp. MPI-PUGE-AT-0046c]
MPKAYTTFPSSQNGKGDESHAQNLIERAHKAEIRTQEHGLGGQDWEVVDGAKAKEIAKDAQDEEWCLVGMMEAEKKTRKKTG